MIVRARAGAASGNGTGCLAASARAGSMIWCARAAVEAFDHQQRDDKDRNDQAFERSSTSVSPAISVQRQSRAALYKEAAKASVPATNHPKLILPEIRTPVRESAPAIETTLASAPDREPIRTGLLDPPGAAARATRRGFAHRQEDRQDAQRDQRDHRAGGHASSRCARPALREPRRQPAEDRGRAGRAEREAGDPAFAGELLGGGDRADRADIRRRPPRGPARRAAPGRARRSPSARTS